MNTTKQLVLCSFFAALTAITSQIQIPIHPVPINLAMFSVLLAGSILGSKFGALSQTVYVIIGATGFPVFAQFKGGTQVLFGPTGGYITGYIVAAYITGFIIERIGYKLHIFAMFLGLLLCYAVGTYWFMFVTKTDLTKSLALCVYPFILGDTIKIILAYIVAYRLSQERRNHLDINPTK